MIKIIIKMNYFKIYFFAALYLVVSVCNGNNNNDNNGSINKVRFTENKNQWDAKIKYKADLDGGALFLEKKCFTYNFYDKETELSNHTGRGNGSVNEQVISHAFRMTFLNAQEQTHIQPKNPTQDYRNYFIGNDPVKWAGNVKNYTELMYMDLYRYIDLQIQGFQNSLKYNFIVAPLGNTADIQLSYEGLKEIYLEKGALRLKTVVNELVEQSPYAYQWINNRKVEVACEFVLEGSTVHFNFPQGYNKGAELIIDPQVIFSASSGSISSNFGHACTYDADGNLYSGGIVFGAGYPIKLGVDNVFHGGNEDVVITKYNAAGSDIVYSTYLGGSSDEIVTSLMVDGANNLFLFGVTGSANFPVTANACYSKFKGGPAYNPHASNGNYFKDGTDIYVCKFNAMGDALLGSTFIGGTSNDGINCNNKPNLVNPGPLDSLQYNYGDYYRGELELDKWGNVYITTSTRSTDFPIINGFDKTLDGLQDAVVFKMNAELSTLIWSTYLGGNANDGGYGLILDESSVYVTGGTVSTNFPVTGGAVQPLAGGGKADGYLTRIKNDGKEIRASTYWGTDKYDQSFFVQLDKNKNVYIFGQTEGKIPVKGAVYTNPGSGQFITKMNGDLNTVLFSTVVGNKDSLPNLSPTAFLVDACSNIYIAGWSARYSKKELGNKDIPMINMPVTKNAPDTTTNGFDFYLMVLSQDAGSLVYGTYWGGDLSAEHVHGGVSRFDKRGIVYQSLCTGCGGNDDYPLTSGAYPHDMANPNGSQSGCNNAVFKIDFQVKIAQADFTADNFSGCVPLTVHFENKSSTGGKILWDFGNKDTTSLDKPVFTYNTPGTYLVKLYMNDPASCNIWDTAFQYITVHEGITADFNFSVVPCSAFVTFSDSSAKAPFSWNWNFGDGTTSTLQHPTHAFGKPGKYDVELITTTKDGCKDTAIVQVDLATANGTVNSDQRICRNTLANLLATGGFAYHWSPSTGLNNADIANPVATPTVTTTYTVEIKIKNTVGDTCTQTLSTTVIVIDPASIALSATADKDTLLSGAFTKIHALVDTTLKILWSPVTGVENPNAYTTKVTPKVTTTYTVTILDSMGCSRTASITIYVINMECDQDIAFVPNTFTPNGDERNDVLYVRSNALTEIYFAIYNRWGELVFETTDLKKGWDGTYKGMKVDPAVFAWYLKGTCNNGNAFFKKGNVTVIK
jgi:gliding motility-associated-like protein